MLIFINLYIRLKSLYCLILSFAVLTENIGWYFYSLSPAISSLRTTCASAVYIHIFSEQERPNSQITASKKSTLTSLCHMGLLHFALRSPTLSCIIIVSCIPKPSGALNYQRCGILYRLHHLNEFIEKCKQEFCLFPSGTCQSVFNDQGRF